MVINMQFLFRIDYNLAYILYYICIGYIVNVFFQLFHMQLTPLLTYKLSTYAYFLEVFSIYNTGN